MGNGRQVRLKQSVAGILVDEMTRPIGVAADALDPAAGGSPCDNVIAVGPSEVTPFRVLGVDALRGLCAIAVMMYHFVHWSGVQVSPIANSALEKAGVYGVEAFFVISGFSLYVASERRDFRNLATVRIFFLKRAFRILPLLTVATLATFAALAAIGKPPPVELVLANLALFPIILDPSLAIATGAWSLGVEWGFYLLFPVFMLLRKQSLWLLGGGLAVLAVFAILIHPADLPSQNELYVSVPNHIAFFLAGMALGRWRPPLVGNRVFCTIFAVILASFVAILPFVSGQAEVVSGWPRGAFFTLSVSLVAVFAAWRGAGSKPLVWLGNVSFALYLIHPLLFAVCKRAFGDGLPLLAVAFVLTMAASTISYYAFERPISAWGKRFQGTAKT